MFLNMAMQEFSGSFFQYNEPKKSYLLNMHVNLNMYM